MRKKLEKDLLYSIIIIIIRIFDEIENDWQTAVGTADVKPLLTDPLTGRVVWFAAPHKCAENQFLCANGYQCYPRTKECDDKADCLDQSDEWNCLCTYTVVLAR